MQLKNLLVIFSSLQAPKTGDINIANKNLLSVDVFFFNIERDRERLKQMLEEEKGVHERKEKELLRRFKETKVSDEL